MTNRIDRPQEQPLPSNWRNGRLGDVATLTTGGTPSRDEPRFWSGDIPWITTSLVDFNVISTAEEFITLEGVANSSAKIFPKGTLIMAMFGQGVTRGKVAILGINAAFNQACVGIVPSKSLHPVYLFHFLSHHYELIRNLANAGSQENLNAGLIKSIYVNLPPIAEQEAIAAVLTEWDRAIELITALLAAKDQLKRGLMQTMFDATVRFQGFRDGWQSRHLGEVFKERREPGVENLPILSVTLDEGVIPRDDIDKPVRSSLEHADHRLVRAGDIAYNMMRMWQGGCGMVAEDGLISPAYVACKPSKEIDSRYAHHMFHSPRMIYLFWAYSYGLTDDRRRLYYEEFARIPVLLPPLKEQKKIAAFIDTVDMEIAQLKQNRDALKKQKRGLMQQLLTGKIRVSDKLLKQAAKS